MRWRNMSPLTACEITRPFNSLNLPHGSPIVSGDRSQQSSLQTGRFSGVHQQRNADRRTSRSCLLLFAEQHEWRFGGSLQEVRRNLAGEAYGHAQPRVSGLER